jgi:predicted outer membrane repeat protein
MRKLLLLIMVCFSLTAFTQTRYLVQLGTEGAVVWTDPAASGGTLVDLTVAAVDLNTWLTATAPVLGDQVWVAAGSYTLTAALAPGEGVHMYGSFVGTETSAAQRTKVAEGAAWEFVNPTSLTGAGVNLAAVTVPTDFDGFSFSGVAVMGTLSSNRIWRNCIVDGGRMSVNGNPQITNSIFKNGIGAAGAALSITAPAEGLLIKSSRFENNASTGQGGAIMIQTGASIGRFEDLVFIGNSAAGNQGGGAVYTNTQTISDVDSFKFINCLFLYNKTIHTSGNGGAVGLQNVSSKAVFENCTFIGNQTLNNGGAIHQNNGRAVFNNCIFRDNIAVNSGGAINAFNTYAAMITNSLITNNTSANFAIQLSNIGGRGYIYNTTIANNTSGEAAVNFGVTPFAEIKNTLFFGNTAITTISSTVIDLDETIDTAMVASNNAFDAEVPLNGGANSITGITAENTFVLPSTFVGAPAGVDSIAQSAESAASNWSLKAGSPAVDAGTLIVISSIGENPMVIWRNDTDIIGIARTNGGAPDIGAYELVQGDVGVIKEKINAQLRVYPTLTTGFIQIETEVSSVRVFDLNGRIIGRWTNTNQIDISERAAGIYLLQLNHEGQVMNYRIVKK